MPSNLQLHVTHNSVPVAQPGPANFLLLDLATKVVRHTDSVRDWLRAARQLKECVTLFHEVAHLLRACDCRGQAVDGDVGPRGCVTRDVLAKSRPVVFVAQVLIVTLSKYCANEMAFVDSARIYHEALSSANCQDVAIGPAKRCQ